MNDDVSERLLRPLVKLLSSAVGLLLFRVVLSLAPRAERSIPGVGVQFVSILSTLVGLIIVGVLLYHARDLASAREILSMTTEEARTAGARSLLLITASRRCSCSMLT